MADEATALGKLVKRMREQRGLSQNQLNKDSGLSGGYVSQLESGARGRRVGRDQVLKLARGLRASMKETERLLQASGHLDGLPAGSDQRPSFESFVNSEPMLTRDQKEMLLRLYRSYVPRP